MSTCESDVAKDLLAAFKSAGVVATAPSQRALDALAVLREEGLPEAGIVRLHRQLCAQRSRNAYDLEKLDSLTRRLTADFIRTRHVPPVETVTPAIVYDFLVEHGGIAASDDDDDDGNSNGASSSPPRKRQRVAADPASTSGDKKLVVPKKGKKAVGAAAPPPPPTTSTTTPPAPAPRAVPPPPPPSVPSIPPPAAPYASVADGFYPPPPQMSAMLSAVQRINPAPGMEDAYGDL